MMRRLGQWRYLKIIGMGVFAFLFLAACGRLELSVATSTPDFQNEVASTDSIQPVFASTPTATSGASVNHGTGSDEAPDTTNDATPIFEAPTSEPSGEQSSPAAIDVTLSPTTSDSEDGDNVTTESDGCQIRSDWPTYQVKRGDTLGQLARLAGSSISELAQANCLSDPNRIEVGQLLRLPRSIELSPTPLPTPEPWIRHSDYSFRISFDHPAHWRDVGDESSIKFRGEDGFLTMMGSGAPYDLDTVTANEANHRLQPYGSSPTIQALSLANNYPARLVLPSADQPFDMGKQALLVVPYAEPIQLGNVTINYLLLMADQAHIRLIGSSLAMPEPPKTIGINNFEVSVIDLTGGGKRFTFSWDTNGANRATIFSGTAQRFMPWWPVEASGELTVDLEGTLFPNPVMTLLALNDITGQEARTGIQIAWPCADQYFFSPEPERCPRGPALQVRGAYQPFERGFMIWVPNNDGTLPSIFAFSDDGQVSLFQDTWTEGDTGDPNLSPPDGLYLAVGGFGKVWRENPEIQARLGWGTARESLYDLKYQAEARESLPGASYLTKPDGSILQMVGTSWSRYSPG